jgi:hypothetical protein
LTERRRVKDIVTLGVTDTEYMELYRTRSTQERVLLADRMGVLDVDHYKEVAEALRLNGKVIRLLRCLILVMCMGGIHIVAFVGAVVIK